MVAGFSPAQSRRRSLPTGSNRSRLPLVLVGFGLFGMMVAQFWMLHVAITYPEFRDSWLINGTIFQPHLASPRSYGADVSRPLPPISESNSAKPTSYLFDINPWRSPAASHCDYIFGNGFDSDLVQCPDTRCHQNPVTHATLCVFNNLQLDRSKIMVSKGGEKIEDVIGRDESTEYPIYQPGAFKTSQTCGIGTVDSEKFPHHLASMMRSLTLSMDSSSLTDCRDGITLLVTRYEYANLYHTLTDWYNTFQVWASVANLTQSVRVIFMDGHSQGSLDSAWATLFGVAPSFISSLPTRSCYRQAILVPPGYTSSLSVDMMDLAGSCSPAPLAQAFAEWSVSRFGLGHVKPMTKSPKILFILRRDYLAHPRIQGRSASRKIENEQELLDRAAEAFPHATIVASEFEHITLEEQIRAVRSASVVIGVHGAALSHILFAIAGSSTLVELMPPEYSARNHFMMFAQYAGIRYERVQIGSEKSGGFHHVPVANVIETLHRALSK